jgi:NAD(P)-dependent dehydrogenase (short-subunit alcohol dehydrogenase family)
MNKITLITGATSGIGRIAAEAIAQAGHTTIFTARDERKAQETQKEIQQVTGNPNVEYLLVDFASLQSVKEAAESVMQRYPQLDILINNAGTWEVERKTSKDGIEMNFAVNHLAPFLLTNLLISHLEKSASARIVTTSSMAHRRNILVPEDIEFKNREYDGIATYSQSKLCNLLFTLQLVKELQGKHITANTVHPGFANTALFEKMRPGSGNKGSDSPEEGARATIYAALSEELEGVSGKFFFKEHEETPTDLARDTAIAQKIWNISLDYVRPFLA